jgi:inosine/xanthosine triphosphatase
MEEIQMEFMIGSTNPAKVKAVIDVLAIHFPQATITEVEVESGVPEQPIGEGETRLGAISRASRAAGTKVNAIGIGLEGGVRILDEQMYLCNWGALTLPDGTRFTAGGAQIPLPKEIAVELVAGKELGPVVDTYFKSSGIRMREGAIGMLTANTVKRDELFVHILQLLVGQYKYHLQSQ